MNKLYLVISILLLAFLVASVYLLPRNINISHINCVDQFGECGDSLLGSLQVGVGNNLTDSQKSVEGVLEFNTLISQYSVSYKLPDGLLVNVIRRKPRFALSNGSGLVALVEGSGVVVGYTKETLLPTVRKDGEYVPVGSVVSEHELFALNLILGVDSIGGFARSEIFDGALVVSLRDGRVATFPLEGDTEILLGSLVMVLSKLGSDEELSAKIGNIDLRFENPVLR